MKINNSLELVRLAALLLLPLVNQAAMSSTAAEDSANKEKVAITQQLKTYERALNTADLDAVMQLYAKDAVFMPQHNLPAVGREAVKGAYIQVFKAIRLDIQFTIDEIILVSKDWAVARTRSNGKVKVIASGQPPAPEANQELFLLHRESDGKWRFARYIFSTTNPPKQQ